MGDGFANHHRLAEFLNVQTIYGRIATDYMLSVWEYPFAMTTAKDTQS
jgi:hypothetical protein